jgi:Xaa-Pro dipeptidase
MIDSVYVVIFLLPSHHFPHIISKITFKVMRTALQLYSNYSCSESVLVEQNEIGWPCKRVLPQVIYVPIVHADACISVEVEREIRVQAFRAFLSESNLDIAIVQDMQDIYWLSGFNTSGAHREQALVVVSQDNLFILSRRLEVTNAFIHVPLQDSLSYNEGDDPILHISRSVLQLNPSCVGWQLDNDRTTPGDARKLFSSLSVAGVCIVDISGVIRAMRCPKSSNELALMRRAGEICSTSMHASIASSALPGVTENHIAGAAVAVQCRLSPPPPRPYFMFATFMTPGRSVMLGGTMRHTRRLCVLV